MILQSRDDDRVGDNLRIYGGYPVYIWGTRASPTPGKLHVAGRYHAT